MGTKQFLNAIMDGSKKEQKRNSLCLVAKRLLFSLVLSTIVTVSYVEVGHDKGWFRAETWYTCLHTHHHFPWQ